MHEKQSNLTQTDIDYSSPILILPKYSIEDLDDFDFLARRWGFANQTNELDSRHESPVNIKRVSLLEVSSDSRKVSGKMIKQESQKSSQEEIENDKFEVFNEEIQILVDDGDLQKKTPGLIMSEKDLTDPNMIRLEQLSQEFEEAKSRFRKSNEPVFRSENERRVSIDFGEFEEGGNVGSNGLCEESNIQQMVNLYIKFARL